MAIMALNHSPKIVTDGLVFAYDMANVQKSWKGMPTTNQFTLPTADTNGFGVQNSTFTRVRTGIYGGYEIKPTDYVWRYNISANDCPYHGWDIPTTTGTVVTFSFDYYVDPSTAGYPITNYLANMENAGSGVSGGYADPTPTVIGVWKRAYFSSTATATGNSRCLLYPGACGGRLGDAGFILYKNPQVEFNAPGSIATPFVNGTRSNTQALIDLTGNNTITASSLTYASDGTFSFNGSNSSLTIPYNSLINSSNSFTVDFWFNSSSISTEQAVFTTTASGYATGWHIEIYTSKIILQVFPSQSFTSSTQTLSSNTNYNVSVTYSGGSISYYLNGVSMGTASYTFTPSTSNLYIGTYTGGSGYTFNGKIYNCKYYTRALSAAEVKQNFNALRGRYGI